MVHLRAAAFVLAVASIAGQSVGDSTVTPSSAQPVDAVNRQWPIWSAFRDVPTMPVVYRSQGSADGGVAGACPPVVVTHSDANFSGGSFVVQGGFAETEVAAASFVVPAASFPLRLDLGEMIFATSAASVQTTTQWTFMVWEGTPATGNLIFSFTSDNKIIPHIVIPPGTNGVNVQFMVDPADPEQIYISDNGSHTFSIGYRIDQHNNQTQNPCYFAPPSSSNAFPTTDVGGLQQPSQNWLYMVDCGPLGCGAGWKTFAQLPSACRPSGDWVIRATYSPVNCAAAQGACCIASNCTLATQAECAAAGGLYRGDGTVCTATSCLPQGNVSCCFQSTGGCVNMPYANCLGAGGIPGLEGSSCTGLVCFPTGACCLPSGACAGGLSPGDCAAQGGFFQGNGSTCAGVTCPMPVGAACFPNGFCMLLTEADATAAGATWGGAGTLCTDANGNGTADICESHPGDLNGDSLVNGIDLTVLLSAWGSTGGVADINHDGIVNGLDMTVILSNWTS